MAKYGKFQTDKQMTYNVLFSPLIDFALVFTHNYLAFQQNALDQQCKPKWDTAEPNVLAGCLLLAIKTGISLELEQVPGGARIPPAGAIS